jgi:hypothetical protein
MRSKAAFGLTVLVTAAGIYATASAAGSERGMVERYYTAETWRAFADVGAKDNGGPGDIYTAQQSLKALDGKTVGVVNGYGINLRRPYVFFHWTATLADGSSLTLMGAVSLRNKTSIYAIEGGTGRYGGARGTVTLTDAGKKGSLATIRYRLG